MKMFDRFVACAGLVVIAGASCFGAPSADRQAKARAMADRAIEYLRAQQDPETGGWDQRTPGPALPAISGLVLTGMLLDPRIDHTDPDVARGINRVLSFRKLDGSIHDGALPTYNTAICVSMLSHVPTPAAAGAIPPAIARLKTMQWGAFDPAENPTPEAPEWTEPVDEAHPYFGGMGYGRNNRPDMSNLQFFLQAMHDAGVSTEDPAWDRALTFLRRVQMDERINPMPYAAGSTQGGFIYATVPDAESVDSVPGQSQAGEMEEVLSDGTVSTRLRSYGSMTYAGFKSLIYADLPRDDPRVVAARDWLTEHYTLEENPGLGAQGFYYYLLVMSRALDAWGESELVLPSGDGDASGSGMTERRRWADDLIDRLAELQQEDGSFAVQHERWMEGDPVLITAYALIALQHAAR